MSSGLVALVATQAAPIVYAAVLPLGAGMAMVGPSLTSQVSKHEPRKVGAVLGLQQGVQSVGQVVGAMVGTLLLGWSTPAPYVAAALLLGSVAVMTARRVDEAA